MSIGVGSAGHQHAKAWSRYPGLIVGVCLFLTYVATLSHNYTAWSISLADSIQSGDLRQLLASHHLLVQPIGWLFWRLWTVIGWRGDIIVPLQVLNALAGALSACWIYGIGWVLTESRRVAILTSLGFGASAGVWLFSTQAEFVTIPLASSLFVLWWFVTLGDKGGQRKRSAAILGVVVGLSALTYLTNVFLLAVVSVGIWASERLTRAAKVRQIVVFLAVFALTFLPVYMGVMYVVFDVRSFTQLQHLKLYYGDGTLYGHLAGDNVFYGAYASLRTLLAWPGIGLDDRTAFYLAGARWAERLAFGLFYVFVGALAATPAVAGYLGRSRLTRTAKRTLVVIGTWALLYSAFAIYWVPKDLEFWLPVLASWWLLVGVVVADLGQGETRGSFDVERGGLERRLPWCYAHTFVAVVVGMLAVVNGFGLILPHHVRASRWILIAESIGEHTQTKDVVITSGGDPLSQYIPHFAQRKTVSVFQLFLDGKGKAKDEIFASLDRDIKEVKMAGGRVYLVGDEPGVDIRWDELAQAGLLREEFLSFTSSKTLAATGDGVFEIVN
jgi:hypothetical protein